MKKHLVLIFFVLGCTRTCVNSREEMTKEQVLEEYLKIAFNMEKQDQKSLLLEYTTGKLKHAIAQANEASFRDAYLTKRYQLKKFSVVGTEEMTPNDGTVSYLLEYLELAEGKTTFKDAAEISTENKALFKKENARWYIEEISEAKTLFNLPDTRVP